RRRSGMGLTASWVSRATVMLTIGAALTVAVRSDAAIVFCQRKKTVAVRLNACKHNEQQVTGATGPQGPTGPTGQTGDAGPSGVPDSGCPGPRINGICLLAHDNTQSTSFTAAALQCAGLGGDLCTDSQAWPLAVGSWQNLYLAPAVL